MYDCFTNTIKLLDFGYSQSTIYSYENKTYDRIQDVYCGSVNYVSPEIIYNFPFDGKKADIWALGILLYIMLVGYFPFDGETIEECFIDILKNELTFPSYISTESKLLIKLMLNSNPSKRPCISSIINNSWFNQ